MEGALIMSAVCYLSVKAMLLLIDCKYRLLQDTDGKPKTALSNGKEYVELRTNANGESDEDEMIADNDTVVIVEDRKRASANAGNKPKNNKAITYSDVGFAAFGTTGRLVIDTALLVSQVEL